MALHQKDLISTLSVLKLDEWEEAHADFVIPTDNSFGLYTNSSIYVVGSRGGFGRVMG